MSKIGKCDIICGDIQDDGRSAEAALLLGTSPVLAKERALTAAALYHAGRVKTIIPSGEIDDIKIETLP